MWKPVIDEAVVGEVRARPPQHRGLGAGGEEHHHVAGEHDRVERLGLTLRRQIEFAQIGDQPPRPRMIDLGGGDQFRVGIDADHVMADRVQVRADATGTATGVEDPGVATDHRIDEPALAGQIGTVGLHRAEPLDVPLAVPVLRVGHPSCRRSHATSVWRTCNAGA